MVTGTFPLGRSVLHTDWPDARFNISGMFVHHPLIVRYVLLMEQGFDCPVPVESVHGAPAVPWNAGRISKTRFNPEEFRTYLEFFYSRGIGYFPTFTNHLIEPKDLEHPVCNSILEYINQRPDLNGVIITSELLSRYIAGKYPALRQIASITKVELEKGVGRVDYYRELGKRFHRYVVHSDDCCKPKLLDQLDRDKAEIILNENCVRDCPSRTRHFDAFARLQRAATPVELRAAQSEVSQIVAGCQSPVHSDRVGNHRKSCNLERGEVKAVYDMGFRHFKLQGRGDDPFCYGYDLVRFTVEPDFVAPLVHKHLLKWLSTVVVKGSN